MSVSFLMFSVLLFIVPCVIFQGTKLCNFVYNSLRTTQLIFDILKQFSISCLENNRINVRRKE